MDTPPKDCHALPGSRWGRPSLRALAACLLAATLAACGGGGGGSSATASGMTPAAELGQLIFKDQTLSASGRMSCATCHDPDRGHASPFTTPMAFGGRNLDQPGTRNPPALRYLRFNTSFQFAADGTPTGGFFWDGRAATLQEQARGPFLNASEMANTDVASLVAKLRAAPYAQRFKDVFGQDSLSDADAAFDRMTFALERYQKEDTDFAPFSSKFDAFTAGKANLTPQEINGLALFNRADKGNCAACHPSTKPANAPGALFTDFSYDSLGVPRNALIPANANPSFFDRGLCDQAGGKLAARSDLCGAFKVPSLRNVALRTHFFHNGKFTRLEDVVRFYVTRDTDASAWYPTDTLGNVLAYDDLPSSLRGNVNTTEGPYNRTPAMGPALTQSEIDAIVVFLQTLTDGYFTP